MSVNSVTQSRELAPTPGVGHATGSPRRLSAVTSPFLQLSQAELDLWKYWQSQSKFQSPYFHPQFTACVDQVRDDVQVARILSRGKLIGLLPFQRGVDGVAEPIGGAINDYHGVLADAGSRIRQADVFRQLGIKRFRFHSWIDADESMKPHIYEYQPAAIANLSEGPQAFLDEIKLKSSTIKRHPQKARKMIRELGPLRLDINSTDPEVLDWVVRRKRDRYARSGVVDFFGVEWTRGLLKQIHQTQTAEFGGLLSALYAGDTLVAAHFGMRCGPVLHYWYPVYDPAFQQYSAGTQLYLEIVKRTDQLGVKLIDFGYGRDAYKEKLTNQRFDVARGCVDFNRLRGFWNKSTDRVISHIKNSPVKQPVKHMIRWIAPAAGQPRV